MTATGMANRVAAEIGRLCAGDLDSVTLRRWAMRRLQPVVPHDAYCCVTIDPLTLLITSDVAEGIPAAAFPVAAANEYLDADVGKFAALARGKERCAILSRATGGAPASSPRFRNLLEPFGFGPELRAAFVDRGSCWGGVTLLRRAGQPDFTAAQARFMARVSTHLAAGLRAALLREGGVAPVGMAPGIVVLDADLQIESLTPEAEYWLDTLGRGNVTTAALPFPVYEVASRVQVLAAGSDPSSPPARLRVRGSNGEWLVLHGSRLTNPRQGAARTAIVIEAARSREVAPLVIRAYGFSPREQAVLERVLSGASTTETARALAISTYTVGDYLQAIFDRVGVRSQRELLAHFLGDPTSTDPTRASIAYGDATRRIIAN